MANQTLERALNFAGYEVEHAWAMEVTTANMQLRSFLTHFDGFGKTGQIQFTLDRPRTSL
jgi:hypothetical protein